MKTGSPSVPSSRRLRLLRARKLSVLKFAQWQLRPLPQPPLPVIRLIKRLSRA